MERIFTWDELGQVRFEGDDYGGVAAYCQLCRGGMEPHSRHFIARTLYGDPVELLRPVLEHLHTPQHAAMLGSHPLTG